ncbi:MAG TPA: hypothetical protein DIT76_04460 [Spartobacteria bacterium]|nr:hypothetical protein [Spartobacteria bacterium]HCP91287.1 hypothetical protein [Spartobacteria bacterium]
MALFGGVYLRDRKVAFLLPIAAMFFSDLVLGFAVYGTALLKSQPVVYLCMLMTVAIGRLIRDQRSILKIASATFASAVIFTWSQILPYGHPARSTRRLGMA